MQTVLSGITSSGNLTLGNYLGAIKNWQRMAKDYKCLFFIADLHAITVRQNPENLKNQAMQILNTYIALGLHENNNSIFFQSHVPEHTELAWILNCCTQMGELSRMTQYKEKSEKHEQTVGLFTYPVLMAADILLYQADFVPTGEDQKQHVELCRDIAIRFNGVYGETFKLPKPLIMEKGARIMSLADPIKKMSKSDSNSNAYILLQDTPDVILSKMKKSVTDSLGEVSYDKSNPEKAGINNLLTIYSCITQKSFDEIQKHYEGKGYGAFKTDLAEIIIEELKEFQRKYNYLCENPEVSKKVYEEGTFEAKMLAQKTLRDVHEKVGFVT